MHDFHYNYIREKYVNIDELLFTVTDFYPDISTDVRKTFDTSDHPEKHESGIKTGVNKNVIGKFKDNAAGKQITHFVGVRAKLYSYKIDGQDVKNAKGIKML